MSEYLMAGRLSELERLQLQARVWNPSGAALLERYGMTGARVLDLGCGALGWLPVLSAAVGPTGTVVGTDIDAKLLDAARKTVGDAAQILEDDLFASRLEPESFDLVHARFQLAPIGREPEQLAACLRLLRPGGLLVLEDPDPASWHFNPPAAAAERLIELILEAFLRGGGDFASGRRLPELLRRRLGAEPEIDAHVLALPHGHPYLRLPVQFAASLRPRLAALVEEPALDALIAEAEEEIAEPGRWGTTFTLIQAVGSKPEEPPTAT